MTRSDRVNDAFTVFADVAQSGVRAGSEQAQQQSLDGLQVALSQPGSIAQFAMTRALYGDAPYGAVASQRSIISATTRDDMATTIGRTGVRTMPMLVITGDVSADEGFALAERYFGDWPHPSTPALARPDASAYVAAPCDRCRFCRRRAKRRC